MPVSHLRGRFATIGETIKSDEQEKRLSDYVREYLAAAGRTPAAENWLQRQIDPLVIATLERSGLVEPAKPLRQQRRNRDREKWVEWLFETACREAESRRC